MLDDAGRMAEDLPCIGCGYNLRGLMPTGGCPECGRAVAHSTRVAKMGRCDPAYLRRISGGVDWLIVTCAIVGLVSLLGALWANFEAGHVMIDRVATILFCIIVLTGAIGFVAVTTPHELVDRGRERRLSRRRIARVALPTALLLVPVMVSMGPKLNDQANFVILVGWMTLLVVGVVAVLLHGAGLAGEFRDRVMLWQLRIAAGLFVLDLLAFPLFIAYNERWLQSLLEYFGFSYLRWQRPIAAERVVIPTVVGTAVLIAWMAMLLLWYRKRLNEATAISLAAGTTEPRTQANR